jgi:hypothetical protein
MKINRRFFLKSILAITFFKNIPSQAIVFKSKKYNKNKLSRTRWIFSQRDL